MRVYGKRKCWVCGKVVSCAGVAWISHNRKHVREGLLKEVIDYDGRVTFRKVSKEQLTFRTKKEKI
jgi:hypothetical protein